MRWTSRRTNGHGRARLFLITLMLAGPSLWAEEITASKDELSANQRDAIQNLIKNLEAIKASPDSVDAVLQWMAKEQQKVDAELKQIDERIATLNKELAEARAKQDQLNTRLNALRAGRILVEKDTPKADLPEEAAPDDTPAKPQAVANPAAGPGEKIFNDVLASAFSAHCIECHGGKYSKSGLDMTTRDALLLGGDSGAVIVEGDAKKSLLYQVMAHEEEPFMPHKADKLPDDVIAAVAKWIEAGAPYTRKLDWPPAGEQAEAESPKQHWAFVKPARPAVPEVHNPAWVANEVDAFILANLEQKNVKPAPEADRETLIRRLYVDLLGLVPPVDEVDAFVADAANDAYEKLVDRLLASPHFGERWGRHWLDLARYADSDGYEKDNPRPNAWRYREWVIKAINEDLPFDQFTIQQLAGDLLPGATLETKVATGFHRNTLTNTEGGVDKEEFRSKAVVDRVSTTGTVWLGLTVGCAECHTHKYDPLTQREFFGMFAFFNNADERDVPAPLPGSVEQYHREKREHTEKLKSLRAKLASYEKDELPAKEAAWEAGVDPSRDLWTPMTPTLMTSANGATLSNENGVIRADGERPVTDTYVIGLYADMPKITGLKLEVLPDDQLSGNGPGRSDNGNFVLSEMTVTVAPLANPTAARQLRFTKSNADFEQAGYPFKRAIDGTQDDGGWAVAGKTGEAHRAIVELAEPIELTGGALLTVVLEQLYGSHHTLGKFAFSATDAASPINAKPIPAEVLAVLKKPADQRDDGERKKLTEYYRVLEPGWVAIKGELDTHIAADPEKQIVKAQTLFERKDDRRDTHIHLRGDFLAKGDKVEPQTFAVLSSFSPRSETPDRLDLAHWIMSEENPLTARVAVNRIWQHLFGRGLVATPDDFGVRGELPSHPALLDWLATEYPKLHWSRKALIKLIVTSNTYRQSSAYRPELVDRDAKNIWLARQNRFRVPGEVVRDINLDASGLLARKVGGPSVRPPQPPGISELTYANSAKWNESKGEDRYRRGLYIWLQRTSTYPMLRTFDLPDTEVTCTKRERSNTPLQALTLLNDVVFVECAQALGKRIVNEMEGSPADRVRQAFRVCLSREPTDIERDRLVALYNQLLELSKKDPVNAAKLIGVPEADGNHVVEQAAWTAVGRAMLNLDEFVTRG